MDQRFPLQASMPIQQRTDSLPDLDMVPINSRSASSSPITTTENPQSSTTSHSQSPRPASPPQIGPAAFPPRPYSPEYGSSFSPPDHYNSLLPPTIPNLEQPTPLTNPLPFQHEYRNQVPIEGEYSSAVPVQDDAILPAPPPYSRYAAGAPQKSEPERRRPQLEMIDVSAAVRGLPTVHIAVSPDGNVTSSSNSHPPGGSDIAAEPFVLQHSDSEVSMQSAQSSAFSTNSNRLLMRGGLSEKVKKGKAKDNKRVCGIKLWWIFLSIVFLSILLSIVLGVTLGMVLKRNQTSKNPLPPPLDGGNLPDNSQNSIFPGGNIPVRLNIVNQNRTCLTNNVTLPGLAGEVEKVLWTCEISGSQLHFEIKPNDYSGDSSPAATLPNRVGTAAEAELVITSTDSAPKSVGPEVNGKLSLRYGLQPPNFFHQPLYKVLENDSVLESKDFERRSASGSPKYNFQILYTKEIILRDSKVEPPPPGTEGAEIRDMEIVWWCKWEKTYIEGMVWMEAVNETSKVDSAFRMTLHESRLSDQELQSLLPGSNPADAAKGAITCQKKMNNGGNLVEIPAGNVGPGGSISSRINKAKVLSEARAVEEVVRRRFGRGSILRRDSLLSQLTERADGGQCLCEWESR